MFSPVQDTEELGIDGAPMTAADEAPELVGPQTIEEERLLRLLYKDLERGERAKAILAEAEMRKIAALNAELEHRPIDGLGCLVARISLDVFLAWIAREGPEFWHEQSNLAYFAHRAEGQGNPGFLIKTKMRPQIVVDRSFKQPAA